MESSVDGGTPPVTTSVGRWLVTCLLRLHDDVPGLLVEGDELHILPDGVLGALAQGRGGAGGPVVAAKGE